MTQIVLGGGEVALEDFSQFFSRLRDKTAIHSGATSFTIPNTEREIKIREIASDPDKVLTAPNFTVAYAQVRSEPGALKANYEMHIAAMKSAHERHVDLIQFPELSLSHYCSLDLMHNESYLKAQKLWLDEIVSFSNSTPGLTAAVGFIDVDWDKTRPGNRPWGYNSLAIIRDGEIVDIIHKRLLPNYSVFDEWRWFEPGNSAKIIDIQGTKVGFLICEDIWVDGYPTNPVKDLIDQGAQYLSHSAASPFEIEKNKTRATLASHITDHYGVPFGSVNMIGTFDGYEGDLPFDGRGLVRSKDGEWLAMGSAYQEELLILNPFAAPKAFIPELATNQELIMTAVDSIQSFFNRLDSATHTTNCAVIGNSGGIDSALVITLCQLALGPDRVKTISLPTDFNSKETRSDAEQLAVNLGVYFREVPIQEVYTIAQKTLMDVISSDPTGDNRISQNLQARIRTMLIMGIAQGLDGVMIQTGNRTERYTNNFTIYADSAGVFAPIADWDKDRIYEVSRYLNKMFASSGESPPIPESIITREASAELDYNQVDAKVMGDKPEIVAPHIRMLVEKGIFDFDTARESLPDTVPDHLIHRWLRTIKASEWKGRQLPPGTRVTPTASGFGRRIPINNQWDGVIPVH